MNKIKILKVSLIIILIYSIIISLKDIIALSYISFGVNELSKVTEGLPSKYHKDIAELIYNENIKKLKEKIEKDPNIIDNNSVYSKVYLEIAFINFRSKSLDLLLSYGIDPNKIKNNVLFVLNPEADHGLFNYKIYSIFDVLFKHGFDINSEMDFYDKKMTLLMLSTQQNISLVKYFVSKGANINKALYSTNETAAIKSLFFGANYNLGDSNDYFISNKDKEDLKISRYLIIDKKALVNKHFYKVGIDIDNKEKFYPVDILRYWIYPLDSEEYKIKSEIINEFKIQGIDYYKTEIPKNISEYIKSVYPNEWKEYMKKY